MKKKFIIINAIVVSSTVFSQIGVNTQTPASSLDIMAKNATGAATNVDGILIPRIDRQRAQSMTGIPVSTMIYVNNIATGTPAGTAININETGYYFFDGTVWTKLKTPTLYNSDGNLTGDRTVTQGTNTLTFNTTATNGFSVAKTGIGNILSVDGANSRAGIGTTTPQKSLHVNGALQVTNELNVGGNASTAGSAGIAGQVLKSNGPGVAPIWQNIAGVPTSTGTVIAVNGQFLVAQEISVQLTADYTDPGNNAANPIGNLDQEIIDNENRYSGNASSNSFTVSANGIYQVTINAQLSTTNSTLAPKPTIGIWDDTTGAWVARVNDNFVAPTGGVQTYTLITAIPMVTSDTYSFRIAHAQNSITVKALSSGTTGSGPVTQMSLKRLR